MEIMKITKLTSKFFKSYAKEDYENIYLKIILNGKEEFFSSKEIDRMNATNFIWKGELKKENVESYWRTLNPRNYSIFLKMKKIYPDYSIFNFGYKNENYFIFTKY